MNTFNLHISAEGSKPTNEDLYRRQVEMLKAFRKRNAISQAEYDKCYRTLTENMGMAKITKI